jgi:hypothetical protein
MAPSVAGELVQLGLPRNSQLTKNAPLRGEAEKLGLWSLDILEVDKKSI